MLATCNGGLATMPATRFAFHPGGGHAGQLNRVGSGLARSSHVTVSVVKPLVLPCNSTRHSSPSDRDGGCWARNFHVLERRGNFQAQFFTGAYGDFITHLRRPLISVSEIVKCPPPRRATRSRPFPWSRKVSNRRDCGPVAIEFVGQHTGAPRKAL